MTAVLTDEEFQARYERLLALVMKRGQWLAGPRARLLSEAEWEVHFAQYQADLDSLRLLGDALRPPAVREYVPLDGDAMVREVRELFAD